MPNPFLAWVFYSWYEKFSYQVENIFRLGREIFLTPAKMK